MHSLARYTTMTLLSAVSSCLGMSTVGCSDGRPDRVPVSGEVLIDGAPVTHGSIMFIPMGGRPAGGSIDSQGRFALSCYERKDGATTGVYRVKITAIEPI